MTSYSYSFGSWLMHLFMVQVGAWLMHLFMVHVDYRLFGIGWCMVDALVDWYKFTTVYLTMII